MKLILVSSLFLCAKAAIPIFEVFPKIAGRCNKDISLTKEFSGLFDRDYHMSHDAQCFVACFHKIYGLMGEDGHYHLSKIPNFLKGVEAFDGEVYEKMTALVTACIKEVEANPDPDYCQHSESFTKCSMTTASKLGLPPERYFVANLEDV